ncbi:metal-dependent hydrolase [Candidatus Bathyarchaeota archaeon]|nr:metal-dependent hydrolase [Candidatus Bathyarchaeota archaeon]
MSKASAKLLKVNFNVPLILVLSVIPDIDLLFDFLLKTEIHRGPTHSVITAILVFIPFFVLYRQKAVPYFTALISHSLIADFLIGGQLQLLWPLSTNEFGFPYINIYDPINIALEFTLFIIALVVMLKTRDLFHFFRDSKLTLILAIPIFTVLLPTFTGYPLSVPILLVLPHLFYLMLFSISILITLKGILK